MHINNLKKTSRGTYSLNLYLRDEEVKMLKRLQDVFDKNEFDTIKYCVALVDWWSCGEIEHEELG